MSAKLAGRGAADVPFLEMQIAYVESLSRIAAALGAPVVRIFTAYEADGSNPYAIWNQTVGGLREMCDGAAEHGVTVAVQNHHDVGVHTDALLELLGDVDRPNCKGGFDGIANYEMCSPIRGGGRLENLNAFAQCYMEWMRQHVL